MKKRHYMEKHNPFPASELGAHIECMRGGAHGAKMLLPVDHPMHLTPPHPGRLPRKPGMGKE